MIEASLSLEEVQEIFANDQFATMAGCRIAEARPGYAVCEMPLSAMHLNAQGGIMGGAIFTLADFALAVAVNVGQPDTVAVDNTIRYLNAPKGTKLIATAQSDKSGRSLAFVTITVTDDLGRDVAIMNATGFRKPA